MQAGRALLVAMLDMEGANPRSCVPQSPFRSLAGVREWLVASAKVRCHTHHGPQLAAHHCSAASRCWDRAPLAGLGPW